MNLLSRKRKEVEDPLGSRAILDFLFGALAGTVLLVFFRLNSGTEAKDVSRLKSKASQVSTVSSRHHDALQQAGSEEGLLPTLGANVVVIFDRSGSVVRYPGFHKAHLTLLEEVLRRHPEVHNVAILLDGVPRQWLVNVNGWPQWSKAPPASAWLPIVSATKITKLCTNLKHVMISVKQDTDRRREATFRSFLQTVPLDGKALDSEAEQIALDLSESLALFPDAADFILVGDGNAAPILADSSSEDSDVTIELKKLGEAALSAQNHHIRVHGVVLIDNSVLGLPDVFPDTTDQAVVAAPQPSALAKYATLFNQTYGMLSRQTGGTLTFLKKDYNAPPLDEEILLHDDAVLPSLVPSPTPLPGPSPEPEKKFFPYFETR